jgi:hypothetical protein
MISPQGAAGSRRTARMAAIVFLAYVLAQSPLA